MNTKKALDRAWQVALYVLSEERRVMGDAMSEAEYQRRYRDAYDSVWGDHEAKNRNTRGKS
jgi:hypothetical protein